MSDLHFLSTSFYVIRTSFFAHAQKSVALFTNSYRITDVMADPRGTMSKLKSHLACLIDPATSESRFTNHCFSKSKL